MVPAAVVDAELEQLAAAPRAGRHRHRRRQLATTATTSAAPRTLTPTGHPLRRRRHQRRRLRAGSRLLPDDRRRGRGGRAARPDLRGARARASARRRARRAATGEVGTAEQGYLHCGPSGAGHFVKMVHNGIEYGLMAAYAEGLNILRNANVGKRDARQRRRDHAAAPSRVLPVRHEPARHRRGLAARQRDRLVAARPHRQRARRRTRSSPISAAACPTPAKAAGRSRRRSTKRCPTPVLSAALYERFSSRGEADFANQVLSAMRHEFGGHVEKPAKGGQMSADATSRTQRTFRRAGRLRLHRRSRPQADLSRRSTRW